MTDISLDWLGADPLDRGVGIHDDHGRSFLISQADLGILCLASSWSVSADGYVRVRFNGMRDLLHRLILSIVGTTASGDHISRQRWDNRRSNLRVASLAENNRNQALRRNNTSGFKGVSFDPRRQKWQAGIGVDGTRKALGRFDTAEEAAHKYDDAALQFYGEFAVTNFPRGD